MAQVVAIKQRLNAADFPFSEIFIEHEGHRFYSRDFFVADTPANRAFLANAFLERLKRFPSGIAADTAYRANQDAITTIMSDSSDRAPFAKQAAPVKRAFSLVRNDT